MLLNSGNHGQRFHISVQQVPMSMQAFGDQTEGTNLTRTRQATQSDSLSVIFQDLFLMPLVRKVKNPGKQKHISHAYDPSACDQMNFF